MSNGDSLDWKDYGVSSIIDTVTNHKHLGNGSIILCHNGAKYTAEALDTLITTLQEKGYELVRISDLIYRDNYTMNTEGRQIPDAKPQTDAQTAPAADAASQADAQTISGATAEPQTDAQTTSDADAEPQTDAQTTSDAEPQTDTGQSQN